MNTKMTTTKHFAVFVETSHPVDIMDSTHAMGVPDSLCGQSERTWYTVVKETRIALSIRKGETNAKRVALKNVL